MNAGESLQLHLGPDLSGEFTASFIKDQRFALELVLIHWGTEPMNGSEHTVGGVGYAGEVHFIHRNMHYANIDHAYKEPNGVLAVAILLNVSCSSWRFLMCPISSMTIFNQVLFIKKHLSIKREFVLN